MNDSIHWENSACDWCGSQETEALFRGPDRQHGLPGEFTMARCTRCGVLRQQPRPAWDSLAAYYPDDYPSHSPLVRDVPNPLRRLDKRYGPWKRLRAVERFQPGGRLLEVGCGTGLFLEEAQRSGRWQLAGVEPGDRAAEYANERLGIPIHHGRFAEVNLPLDFYDVIVMWNVLEHLDHPIQDLRYAHSLLKEGGWLVFSVPNLESWEARVFGPYWLGWELPRHLYLFPRQQLEVIIPRLGFRLAARRCLSTSYSVLGESIDFWAQTWKNQRLRKAVSRVYRSIFTRALLLLPLGVSDRLGLSTIITYFAQKTSARSAK
ncbi:MAG: class I SAM-dependent methyltransferase [Chloroflexi bacterium]|nr:class I SAM-dependent methyltransferase [Chloroflexota bacterium]